MQARVESAVQLSASISALPPVPTLLARDNFRAILAELQALESATQPVGDYTLHCTLELGALTDGIAGYGKVDGRWLLLRKCPDVSEC